MANIYNSAAAESKIDNLIGGTQISVKVVCGTLDTAQDIARGTPLTCDPATGFWSKATQRIDGVLLDELKDSALEFAVALTGEFNQNVMDLSALTDANKAIIEARKCQIYIAPSHKAPYVQIGE